MLLLVLLKLNEAEANILVRYAPQRCGVDIDNNFEGNTYLRGKQLSAPRAAIAEADNRVQVQLWFVLLHIERVIADQGDDFDIFGNHHRAVLYQFAAERVYNRVGAGFITPIRFPHRQTYLLLLSLPLKLAQRGMGEHSNRGDLRGVYRVLAGELG